jgi:hypothetical protein
MSVSLLLACYWGLERLESRTTSRDQRTADSERRAAQDRHVRIRGTGFIKGSAPFEWRGVTAFRLAEMIAHGREPEAVAYIDWAAEQRLTVVRVLLMANTLFRLKPEDGLRAAARLLELASARGLHVELVALADTREVRTDLERHVKAVGAIAAAHPNALVEIANEPWHSTQDRRLHDPAFVKTLAALVPDSVPVALGSAERNVRYADGTYATWHSPRSDRDDGWGHVLAHARGAALVTQWDKPVVSDEPIGAHRDFIPGRRDNAPARFAAAGALTRLAGIGATFHYEGGLQARIPAGRQLECFRAWISGLDLMSGVPDGGWFLTAEEVTDVATVEGFRAVFGREDENELWIVGIDPRSDASVTPIGTWKLVSTRGTTGVRVFQGSR